MAGYIGNIPVPQGTQTRQNFTATASQTSFPTIGYTTGFIDVYLNGVKLINGTDFTATNGSDVVLASAASASDVLDVVIFDTFDTSSGTFSDTTLKNNVTLKNDTEEDSDGGRASKIIYQGEQSGGEISTLAEIQASHDGTADDQKGDLIFKTNDGSDNNAPTEAARIDSGQNLLVGKTADTQTDAGHVIFGSGAAYSTRNGFTWLHNRLSTDGEILRFQKNDSTVGSISTEGGYTKIIGGNGTVGSGLGFFNLAINARTAAGAVADNTVSLGEASNRFKDLYLGGGVVFDAVAGSATSNTLDDYEEGLHSPTFTGSTSGSVAMRSGYQQLSYQVVGNRCTMTGRWEVSGGHSLSGNVRITLPFATANLTDQAGVGVGQIMLHRTGTDWGQSTTVFGLVAFEGESQAYLYYQPSGTGNEALVQGSQLDSNFEGFLSISFPIA